uniref:Uncharacterized protein n=1 Tax=Nelumbo nucifera TaxID=4432 RepID=A0A822Z841_NELNU|nr:TPA_asm: hypothetical protein HUJ06_015036 [Nelumbo nucifera]
MFALGALLSRVACLCHVSGDREVGPNFPSSSISKFPEISDYPAKSLHNFDNNDYNPVLRSSFYVDNNSSYEMDDFNMSAMSVMGGYETSDFHMAESNWAYDDMAESIWNIDELWQFKKLQDRSI